MACIAGGVVPRFHTRCMLPHAGDETERPCMDQAAQPAAGPCTIAAWLAVRGCEPSGVDAPRNTGCGVVVARQTSTGAAIACLCERPRARPALAPSLARQGRRAIQGRHGVVLAVITTMCREMSVKIKHAYCNKSQLCMAATSRGRHPSPTACVSVCDGGRSKGCVIINCNAASSGSGTCPWRAARQSCVIVDGLQDTVSRQRPQPTRGVLPTHP